MHPPAGGIHFLKQLPQTAQTIIAHAAIQADTDLPKNQLELEHRQPIMHNVTTGFIKFYSLRPMNYQLNNFAAYPATEHSASKPPLSAFVGIVRHDNVGTPLFGYNLERPLKKRLYCRLTLKVSLEAELHQGNVHL
ncbi:hypothetical protein BGI32_02330 [Snodgrassella alvi]|uniref:Uncharacterized protein n=1 Tax=Snodgrassella alvi TaxID=1196083 RepID=A0A2N9WVU3_9NEIS|nr:hypothetical protein [Snodgrassella alvi]PIT17543.1 hypothetical protein BGI32_02330 [Snodgrassella alvi]